MISIEKLNSSNFEAFKLLNDENINNNYYDKDFFEYYNKEKFIFKIMLKKFVKLFTYNGIVIGYMWYEVPLETSIRIWSMYVKSDYIHLLNSNTLNSFNNKLSYESIDESNRNKLLKNLGFNKVKPTLLMELHFDEYKVKNDVGILKSLLEKNYEIISKVNRFANVNYAIGKISIEPMKVNYDEYLRCEVQNEVFEEDDRIPLNVLDIENDISQEYYIPELSLFIKVNGIAIGYGQVIYNRGMYMVVNFGILKEFRGYGFGKILLNDMIIKCIENKIDNLSIRVEENNYNAIHLYSWIGFSPKLIINNWER